MTFLKSSCSTVVSCEEQWVFQAFVNPASAIKNKSLTRTSNNKSDEKPVFLWWFQSSLSCCSSFSYRIPPQEARPVFSQIKTWRPRRAHDGLRVTWLAGGRPGLWGAVFWLLDNMFSVFSPLLPQPPLRLRARRSCFSSNSSVLLCQLLSIVFFLFCFVLF